MAVETSIDFTDFEEDPRQWFVNQAQTYGLRYFLAHDDDGVIWGHVTNGQLKLSGEAFSEVAVPLRALTLQQARLFDEVGELLVWRGDGGWRGRFLDDNGVDPDDMLDETHRLWGTASDPPGPKDGFTLMRDGKQGLLHAPPVELPDPEPHQNRRAELCIRHHLKYDDQGQAYIARSRLVAVQEGGTR
ncbi:MAG: TIGR03984 family CRISPR-associated protein [Chloroflexi bacterium]|nr:TIGR03984 family CRISPR-associated protein [Chloroflexota bacterium]